MEPDKLSDLASRVNSKKAFLEFVEALRTDWELARAEEAENPSPQYGARARGWENLELGSFLDAMAMWLDSADGYYRNTGQAVDTSEPSWRLLTDMLMGAMVHE